MIEIAGRVLAFMPLNLNCSANQKNKGKQCRLQQRGMIETATQVPHDLDELSLVYSRALRKAMVDVNVMQEMGPPLTRKKPCPGYWRKAAASLREMIDDNCTLAVYRAGQDLLAGNSIFFR